MKAIQTNHLYIVVYLGLFYLEAHFGCHDIQLFGTSPIKLRQRTDMSIAVDRERIPDSTIPLCFLNPNFKLLAIFCACTARFVSDMFRNHIVGFPMTRLILYTLFSYFS